MHNYRSSVNNADIGYVWTEFRGPSATGRYPKENT